MINTAGTTEWAKFVKENENVELARRNTQSCADGYVGDGAAKETVYRVEFTVMWRETVERKPNACKTTKTSGWSGTDDTGKGRPGTGKGKEKRDNGKGKGKNKNKGKGKHRGKKEKKGIQDMEGHDDTQETQTGQEYTEWTDTSWDRADTWTDADCKSSDWSTDLWADPAWEPAVTLHDRRNLLENNPIQLHGGSISMLGGLTMSKLSVGDEREREQSVNKMKGTKNGTTFGTLGMNIGFRIL